MGKHYFVIGSFLLILFLIYLALPRHSGKQKTGGAKAYSTNIVDYPAGAGRDLLQAKCNSCHSAAIYLSMRLTEYEWDKVLQRMVTQRRMPPLSEADRKTVLDYLATNLGR